MNDPQVISVSRQLRSGSSHDPAISASAAAVRVDERDISHPYEVQESLSPSESRRLSAQATNVQGQASFSAENRAGWERSRMLPRFEIAPKSDEVAKRLSMFPRASISAASSSSTSISSSSSMVDTETHTYPLSHHKPNTLLRRVIADHGGPDIFDPVHVVHFQAVSKLNLYPQT